MASNIGLPSISVEFKKKGTTVISRGNTGIVAIILKDTKSLGFKEILSIDDVPADLSVDNKKYINLAMLGNVTSPSKVLIYVLATDGLTQEALDYFESIEFNYIVMPKAIEADKTALKAFIDKMRDDIKYKVKAVMNLASASNKGIIASTQDDVVMDIGTITADEYCVAQAGLICGTPLSQSVTFAVPKNVVSIPSQTRTQVEAKVKLGELVLIKEMGKIRVARGVTSYIPTAEEVETEVFQKIKLMDISDLIHNDIRSTCINSYVGKYPNNYDNKCLLVVALRGYFDELVKEQLIEKDFTVEIDVEAQAKYLKSIGVDISAMNEQEIKEANTKDKVFIKIYITLVDAMESIAVEINI